METKILAKVNGTPITELDVDRMLMAMGQNGQAYNNPQGRTMVLEQLISKKLMLLDAEKNLYEYDSEFKAEFEMVKEDMLANFAIKKCVESITVTDDEVKKEYDDNKDKFVTGESADASHILVDSEEKANELLKDINEGNISFEDCARQNSTCPSSSNGGSLGEFTRGQMVPEFDNACFNMNVGEIAGPVKTQFGYHLIKLNAKNEPKTLEFDEVKDGLKQQILGEKRQNAFQSKINQLKILYPVDQF